jgi:hypothetical protein
MDSDRKTTGLKALQGKIWKCGFESGALLGQYVHLTTGLHTYGANFKIHEKTAATFLNASN